MAQVKPLKFNSTTGRPRQTDSSADEITFLTGQFGNVKMAGNTISSQDVNGNITILPNGSGSIQLDGQNWPQADGTANQILKTDGAGQLSYVDAFASKISNSYTADEALLAVDALYISAADNVSKADASAESTARVIGFAEAGAADTASVNVVSEGVLGGFTGLTAGATYFLSETAGLITTTPPSNDESAVVQVGYAKSTTELHIHIEQVTEIDTN